MFTPYKAYSFEQAEHDEQISNMEFGGGDVDGGTDAGADGVVVPGPMRLTRTIRPRSKSTGRFISTIPTIWAPALS